MAIFMGVMCGPLLGCRKVTPGAHRRITCLSAKVICGAAIGVTAAQRSGKMLHYAIAYGVTVVAFLFIDFIWLGYVARGFYAGQIGSLMLDQPRLGVAAAFYLLYVIGIVVFAIMPALKADSARTALMLGALFGLIAYATYDLTNYATLKNWPVPVVIVDIAWGAVLTAVSAFAGFHGTRFLAQSLS
jgi:uncharacterized membrane protein